MINSIRRSKVGLKAKEYLLQFWVKKIQTQTQSVYGAKVRGGGRLGYIWSHVPSELVGYLWSHAPPRGYTLPFPPPKSYG